jgi:hypothetical protein
VDRDQAYLMAPSLRDWVAQDHLAWTVLAAVEEMDLSASMGRIARMVMAARRMTRR